MKKSEIEITIGQEDKITVFIPYNPIYIEKVKSIRGYRWDPKRKCWFFPYSDDVKKKLLVLFRDENVWIDPVLRGEGTPFADLRREMVSRKYSPKTVKAYLHYNKDFLKFTGKQIGDITEGDINSKYAQTTDEHGSSQII